MHRMLEPLSSVFPPFCFGPVVKCGNGCLSISNMEGPLWLQRVQHKAVFHWAASVEDKLQIVRNF